MRMFLILILLLITGCVGAPVGFGGTHKVVQENSKSITFLYDNLVGGYSHIMDEASAHCKKFDKTSVPTQGGKQGVLNSQTFECK